jgi:hypothetical protein
MFVGCGCNCKPPVESTSIDSVGFPFASQSYSESSYGSSIADPPGTYPTQGCQYCFQEVGPAAYEVDFNYNGTLSIGEPLENRPCCSVYRDQKKYTVFRQISSIAGACLWESKEVAHWEQFRSDGSLRCVAMTGINDQTIFQGRWPRIAFTLQPNRPGLFFAPWHVTIYFATNQRAINPADPLTYNINIGYCQYALLRPDGTPYNHIAGPPPFCLTTLTFKRVNMFSPNLLAGQGPGWSGTYLAGFGRYRGAPCKQVLFSGFDPGLPEFVTLRPVPA